jgi:hypothetical protein
MGSMARTATIAPMVFARTARLAVAIGGVHE